MKGTEARWEVIEVIAGREVDLSEVPKLGQAVRESAQVPRAHLQPLAALQWDHGRGGHEQRQWCAVTRVVCGDRWCAVEGGGGSA